MITRNGDSTFYSSSMSIEVPLHGPAWVFFVLSATILVAPLLAERARLPGVIGLVFAGIVVGPEGLGLVTRVGTIEQLGGFGLLYLMFLAGLELDLDVLRSDRRPTIVFGLLTFSIPILGGTAVALWSGFGPLSAVLLGSLWASHTLVVYPTIRRSGIMRDASVTTAVGATVITDTLALIVLAVVAGSAEAESGGLLILTLIPGLGFLAFWCIIVVPRMAEWFFRGLGQDRTSRFIFILVAFLSSAMVAEIVGVEGIIGAFFAGLALNRLVPNGGVLMQRVEFVGSSLLIPIFLISVGMLVDLRVVIDPSTIGLAAAFTTVAISAKWLAAEIAGRFFGFDRSQIGVMFALSNAQAAATLAATIVGFEIGLLDERAVNAVLVVILVTVIVASTVASRASSRVVPLPPSQLQIGRMVLAPIARPESVEEIMLLATWVARADAGQVLPFHVVTAPDSARVTAASPLLEAAESSASSLGADVDAVIRVDRSVASGVVNTVIERDASLVLLGWRGETSTHERFFGTLFDDIVARVPCLVAACWLPGREVRRLVLDDLDGHSSRADGLAARELCSRLSKGSGLPMTVVGSAFGDLDPGWQIVDPSETPTSVLTSGDLVVVPGGSGRSAVGSAAHRLVTSMPELGLIVVHAASPGREVGVAEVFAGN